MYYLMWVATYMYPGCVTSSCSYPGFKPWISEASLEKLRDVGIMEGGKGFLVL